MQIIAICGAGAGAAKTGDMMYEMLEIGRNLPYI